MPILATAEDATEVVEEHSGFRIELREYIGKLNDVERGPQAVSTFQPAGFTSKAHFHRVDGFQVVIEGETRFPDHVARRGSVHYTDAFTPYGPFTSQQEGMRMFVLRARHDIGAQRMPESRKLIPRRGGREIFAECRLGLDNGADRVRIESLIDLQEDELSAYELVAPAGATLPDSPAAGSGKYQVVLDGVLDVAGKILPRSSLGFLRPGETFGRRTAGPNGAHVLELQFPRE
jgi:hypothetical protein